ncbi:MAG: hypothetical protein OEM59_22345, partial [Rhodospirillales bacterium]|nr:hypothetical protein [Rhodospirillales bacterium]
HDRDLGLPRGCPKEIAQPSPQLGVVSQGPETGSLHDLERRRMTGREALRQQLQRFIVRSGLRGPGGIVKQSAGLGRRLGRAGGPRWPGREDNARAQHDRSEPPVNSHREFPPPLAGCDIRSIRATRDPGEPTAAVTIERMFLHLHRPGPPLDRFVELVTYFEGYSPGHTKEKLLPDGAVEIVVDLTDTPKKLYDRKDHSRARDFRGAWISGMRRDWIVIEASQGSSMSVIRFRPGGAFPFLGFAVEGITDTVDHLDAVLGKSTRLLRERLLAAPTVDTKMAAVEGWLLERAGSRLEPSPVIEYMARRLFAPAGIRITDVVEEIGYSQRHVLSLFRRWVGLSPKRYGRIRRFQQVLTSVARSAGPVDLETAALQRAPAPTEPDWAEVAMAGLCRGGRHRGRARLGRAGPRSGGAVRTPLVEIHPCQRRLPHGLFRGDGFGPRRVALKGLDRRPLSVSG